MSDSDEASVEEGTPSEASMALLPESGSARLLSRRKHTTTIFAAFTAFAVVVLLVIHQHWMVNPAGDANSKAAAMERGMMALSSLQPAECKAYTDCAAMSGNCCPTNDGTLLGCCSSPMLDASAAALVAPLEINPDPILEAGPGQCIDTPGWTNGYYQCNFNGYTLMHGCTATGLTCSAYALLGFCANGKVVPGKEWAVTAVLHSPNTHCCVCGKAPEIPAEEVVLPDHSNKVKPAQPNSHGLPTLIPPLPTLIPPLPTSPPLFPLAGGAAPNGTQGEPVGPDCTANPGCAQLGMTGLCCPTADGTDLGCCKEQKLEVKYKPKAAGPGPLMTFYMYRVSSDENYPLNGVNMANLAGDMWYLHNEVVHHCPRKFNMERLLRFKVTMRATAELYGQKKNFDRFVAFDSAKCTVPMCQELHWDPFGFVVGCTHNSVGQVALPGTPTWFSLPGTCPGKFYYEKTGECASSQPGGECPTSDVTGAQDCTYYFERAGEIRLDELSGLRDYNKNCQALGLMEYDEATDRGVGTKFWDGKRDEDAGRRRMEQVKRLFAQQFPDQAADYKDPTCDA